jgi:hypothetical protein
MFLQFISNMKPAYEAGGKTPGKNLMAKNEESPMN